MVCCVRSNLEAYIWFYTLKSKLLCRCILYLSTHNLSLLFFPIQFHKYNKRYIFNQLLHSFKQSFLCSLINKNIYTLKSIEKVGYFVNNDIFKSILKDDINNKVDQKFIMDHELSVYQNNQNLNLSRNFIFDILVWSRFNSEHLS